MGLAVGVGLKLSEKWKAFTELGSRRWDIWRLVCGEREKKAAWVWGWRRQAPHHEATFALNAHVIRCAAY